MDLLKQCSARSVARVVPGLFLLCSLCGTARTARAESEETPKPFKQAALGVSLGTQGVGLDFVTNLKPRLNLRGGGDFLRVSPSFIDDGKHYDGRVALQSGQIGVDWRPMRTSSFRVSPGFIFYNGNSVNAAMHVPAGSYFEIHNVKYYSSTTNPVTGNINATFPKAGPRITVGFDNLMMKHGNRHAVWSSEFGVAIFGTGNITDVYAGSACGSPDPSTCANAATDPGIQANVTAEQARVQQDFKYTHVYPILRTGFTWRF